MKILKSDTWTGVGATIGEAAANAHEAAHDFLLELEPGHWRATNTAAALAIEEDNESGIEVVCYSFALTITWLEDTGND